MIWMCLIAGVTMCAVCFDCVGDNMFQDHGVAARVAESRGVVTTRDALGRHLVIACSLDNSPRGWILVTDIDSEKTTQHFFPEGVPNSPPYASLMSRNGRFYTGAGPTLLEFDPTTRKWLFHGVPDPQAACFVGEAITDGPDALIYIGTYPDCHLVSYNPQTHEMVDHGQMDAREKYFSYLAFDAAGWAYCGIGTARCNIIAFNPRTREKIQMIPEEDRKTGTGLVFTGVDGKVYGNAAGQWKQFYEGKATPVARENVATKAPTGSIGWGVTQGLLRMGGN